MNQLIIKTIRISKGIFVTIASIAIFLGVIFFFRWIGLKGLLGFAVGVLITGFMFMTNNIRIRVLMDYILKN